MVVPPLLQLQVMWARLESHERLEGKNLQTVVVETKDIVWAEEGKEIWINGELFDINNISETNTGLTLCGIFDKKETSLQKLSQNIEHPENKEQGIQLSKYFKFLNDTYFQNIRDEVKIPTRISIHYSQNNIYPYEDIFIKIPLPPPKI